MTDLSGAMYALATVMTVVAIVAIGLRFWARRIKRAALSWDDYAIVPALVRVLSFPPFRDTMIIIRDSFLFDASWKKEGKRTDVRI